MRHDQFAHLCTGRNSEHFYPATDLLCHVRQLRIVHGDPDPEWPTMDTIGRSALPVLPEPESDERITIAEASARFGIKVPTIQTWARRRRISPAGLNDRGVRVFYADHIRILANTSHTRA